LIADEYGGLHVLGLVCASGAHGQVAQLTVDLLGETSLASSLCYLDDGLVFVGSAFGDSQLVRLLPEPADDSSLEVLEAFTNLGPIVDMCMVDVDAHGRGQIVTCSGFGKDGSLRVVRNGVGLDVQAEVGGRGGV
jgi:DNA damage-binding protein 1